MNLLLFGMVLSTLTATQKLTGVILDIQNYPIDYAMVQSVKTQTWVLSDENGFFIFPSNFSQGDSLVVSRIGFKTMINTPEKPNAITIYLERDVISLDAVNVEGAFSLKNANWGKESISPTNQISRNSMLQSIPGSLIKTYGGKAGVTLLAIDGGKPEHTKIVLDGIELTSPQNGLTDLSEIPKLFYQQVFLSKNPGIDFGSGAMDGVIHLRPWMDESRIMFRMGSFGEENQAVIYSFPFSKTTIHLVGGRSTEKGNYTYPSFDSTAIRNNNDFNQNFGGGQIRYLHNSNTIIKGSLFLSNSDRGVAGSVAYLSPNARRTNELILANAKVVHLFSSGYFTTHLSHRFNDEQYNDGLSDPSGHQVSTDKLSVDWNQKWTHFLITNSTLSVRQESIINSTDIGSQNRKHLEGAIVTHLSPIPLFSIQSGIRFDKSSNQNSAYHIQGSMHLPFGGNLIAEIGTGFHLPTFNDLYWPSDLYSEGNPSLQPETSLMKSIRIDFPLAKKGSIGIHWRLRNSKDLITWTAGSDWIWRPVNLDKTSRETATVSFAIPQFFHGLSISGNTSKINTIDESTGKSLDYVPNQTGFIKIGYSRNFMSIDIQGHFTGERTYAGYNSDFNPIEKTIDPISNVTLGFHATIPWLKSAQCHVVINNVVDRDISFFPDYPEPGRSVTAGLSINF